MLEKGYTYRQNDDLLTPRSDLLKIAFSHVVQGYLYLEISSDSCQKNRRNQEE